MSDVSNEVLSSVEKAYSIMSLGQLKKNSSNYLVLSFLISISFILGISIMIGTLVAFLHEDQNLSIGTTSILVIINFVIIIILFIAYNTYLRNIGKYVHGRMRPLTGNQEDISKCKNLRNLRFTSSQSSGNSSIEAPKPLPQPIDLQRELLASRAQQGQQGPQGPQAPRPMNMMPITNNSSLPQENLDLRALLNRS